MKIHKILAGSMTAVVMVASLNAAGSVSLLKNAGYFAAKPFTWMSGKVKNNPKKTFAAVAGVAASAGCALKGIPSKAAVIDLLNQGKDSLPSAQQLKAGAQKVWGQCTKENCKAIVDSVIRGVQTHSYTVAAVFITSVVAAYSYKMYAKCKRVGQEQSLKSAGYINTRNDANIPLEVPSKVKRGFKVQSYFALNTVLSINDAIRVHAPQCLGTMCQFGANHTEGIFIKFAGRVFWIDQGSLDYIAKKQPAVMDALLKLQVKAPKITN